jgi:hypothetical protein
MIQVHVGTCVGCSAKVCKRCGQCHSVACDDHMVVCRALFVSSRADKHVHRHRRIVKRGAQRRLRKAVI